MTFSAGQKVVAAQLNDLSSRGLIDSTVNAVTPRTTTTTETVGSTITFTATTAATYQLIYTGSFQSSVANDIGRLRIRYQSGATLTTSGTQLRVTTVRCETINGATPFCLVAHVTGISGQFTAGGTIFRGGGTGTVQVNASASDEEFFSVIRIE